MDHLVNEHPTDDYGYFQARGRLLQQWLDEPHRPGMQECPFGRTGLAATDLIFQNPAAADWSLSAPAWDEGDRLGLLNEGTYTPVVVADDLPTDLAYNSWEGAVEEGAIWIDSIFREDGPPMSEVTRVIYEAYHDPDTLQYITVLSIVNTTTKFFVTNMLLQGNWPDQRPDPRDVWEFGTPQYQALLGLPFGTLVATLLLASFPRSTVRVARIHTWMNPINTLHMRFDIEHTFDKFTRDFMSGVNVDEDMPDASDGSKASSIKDTEMTDVFELGDPAAYFVSGQKVSVSQGKRGANSSSDDERMAKKMKV